MRFREWLLNEDPDEIRGRKDDSGKPITFRSGVTFTLLDGYWLWMKNQNWVMHEVIATHVWECRDAVEAALKGRGPAGDVDRCLGYSLNTGGRLGPESLRQLNDTADLITEKNDVEAGGKFVAYRNLSLNRFPDIILGRIWPQHRVVSFWNRQGDINSKRDNILSFMRTYGADPKDYEFEVQNEMMTHGEFMAGRKATDQNFDPSKVHTMLPGEQKTRLMNAMGFLKSKPVDARYRREGD